MDVDTMKKPGGYNNVTTRALLFVLALACLGEGIGRLFTLTLWNPRIVLPVAGKLARERFKIETRYLKEKK